MNLLIDTHALIWFLEDDPKLSSRARAAMRSPDTSSYVSDATAWEMCIKHSMGKLRLPAPFEELFPDRLKALGFNVLPIRHEHLYKVGRLPWPHRDPFDRLLIAQALTEGVTLATCDQHFPAYGVPLLW